jgi:AcrR family transcriptional regulator
LPAPQKKLRDSPELAAADGAAPRKTRRLSRVERTQQTRQALLEAASTVVGETGYSNAMIAMITARAKVAQGTFYNYFDSRQDLFDQLLPALGQEMLAHIRKASAAAGSELEREELSFRAFFEFLKIRPEFYRILYEAEVFAPLAFKQHVGTVAAGYVRVLQRARSRRELPGLSDKQLEAIAYTLMGARHYLCSRYSRRDGEATDLPEWVVDAYMTLVKDGLFGSRTTRR